MQIQLNGEPRMMTTGESTVADLLRELEIRPDRVAVEINLDIVDRQEFERRVLREGDRVEVISFIGGGAEGRGVAQGCRVCSPSAHDRNVLARRPQWRQPRTTPLSKVIVNKSQ
jgi:sulfur carrier protein